MTSKDAGGNVISDEWEKVVVMSDASRRNVAVDVSAASGIDGREELRKSESHVVDGCRFLACKAVRRFGLDICFSSESSLLVQKVEE